MESIISRGKNIEEAIQLGLKLLEVSKKEVNIEIIQQEEKGFMGIGKKKAIVKLSYVQNKSENQNNIASTEELIDSIFQVEQTENSGFQDKLNIPKSYDTGTIDGAKLEGKAWVKDGQIYCKDSLFGYSTVDIGEGIHLFKNQQLVTTKSTVITEQDNLQIRFEDKTQETQGVVEVDKEKINATLEINPGYIIEQRLNDVEPARNIKLTASERKKTIINTLTYDDVMKKLKEFRITYGVNHQEINAAINSMKAGIYVIASGKKAEFGKNGKLELKVDVNPRNGLVEDENGTINFREPHLIPTVEKGTIIAIVHPPIPGKPGITVMNEPLLAKQTYPLKLVLKGILEVDNNLVAIESGRPSVEQRGNLVKASIVPKLVHRNNVNLSSGNIRFDGDVEIIGEIEEGMAVEAGGDIYIHKFTVMANIVTSKSIVVKGNVISSILTAGKNNMLVVEVGQLLAIMYDQLNEMIALIRQLKQSPAFKSSDFASKGLQPLIRILLEKRFKGFLSLVKKYLKILEDERSYLEEEEWYLVAVSLKQIFLTLSNQITTMNDFLQVSQQMKKLVSLSEISVEPNSFITILDSINSSLFCSGDINIIGKGCVNTKVRAGGKLSVKGILRGGEVYGHLGASIYEVGANSGTKTIVSVPSDQKIKVTKACAGTILKIGNTMHTLKEERKNFIACLNSDDAIIFLNEL